MSSYPSNSILNPGFKYTSSAKTNVAKTFARIRKQLADQAKPKNVQPIRRIGAAK